MRIAFFDYDGKGTMVGAALEAAGHRLVGPYEDADVALIDHDVRRDICDLHEKVVLYPHGGNPLIDWDGHFEMHPHVRLHLTHSTGHAEVLRATGFPAPCESIGWCYSELAPPRYPDRVRNVLFAPEHPGINGYINPKVDLLNERIKHALRRLDVEVDLRLWLPGGNLSYDDIDAADVVVATGTVAYLAAARGAPLLMFGSDLWPDIGAAEPFYPPRWNEYRNLFRYPFDFDDAVWVSDLLYMVAKYDYWIEEWRSRFIQPFDPVKLVRLIEEVAAC